MTKKVEHGQFYTIRNPFFHPLVKEWVKLISNIENTRIVEPFAGANNIIRTFVEAFPQISFEQWEAYDLHPEEQGENVVPQVQVVAQDTIKNPVQTDIVVTNPPYLANFSAARKGIKVDFGPYVDLYELALNATLSSAKYVAAIIPETFITRKLFRENLYGFISIEEDLFEDTTFPVGLALWVPQKTSSYQIWRGKKLLGSNIELAKKNPLANATVNLKNVSFNVPNGKIGLYAADGGVSRIRFARGEVFHPEEIKHTSRIVTRLNVSDKKTNLLLVDESNLDIFIETANNLLEKYRQETQDLFLTTFKGKTKAGIFRKRLDYKTAKYIISEAVEAMSSML